MAGIYIHIPFCRQSCHYCDFHFSTNLTKQANMVEAICKEIRDRNDYINEEIKTIYFGGGTPSILSGKFIKQILATIRNSFQVSPLAEITLEGNPEDLTTKKLAEIYKAEINRLSIGFQTFSDEKLKWMNRIHSSKEAIAAYQNARHSGFGNISLDLIYALPGNSMDAWEKDLYGITSLEPEHVSIYGLTIEEKTVFGKWKKTGRLIEENEEKAAEQYLISIEILKSHGYEQYEVSNFSKPGFSSKHNSSYWAGEKYLGVGPGAHSYDSTSRRFNVRNNAKYLKAIEAGDSYFEIENLSKTQRMNENILTQLRTVLGINLEKFHDDFKVDLRRINKKVINQLADQEYLKVNDQRLYLTAPGFLVADEIALKLFFEE